MTISAKPIYIPATSHTNIRVLNMRTIYKQIRRGMLSPITGILFGSYYGNTRKPN
jgi:hypothetical protein